ncbi:disease resistance protein RPV1-like isoform X10 [Fagus crenata]
MCCPHQRLGDTQHPFFPIRLNPGDSMGTLGYHISSGATKYQPFSVPDYTLGLKFGLDLPDLGFDSTVSEGFDLGSSSMPNNDDSDLGLLPLFPTSYASHSNSIETTNNEFDSTLKGFHADGCDLSLLPHAYPMGSQDYQPPTVHISLPSSEGLDLPALAFGSTENLKDGTPSFLTNISGTILSSGEVLDGMRECGHKV